MKAKSFLTALLAGAALFPLTAQVEVAPPEQRAEWLKAYQLLTRENSIWSDHANRMKEGTEKQKTNVTRVVADAKAGKITGSFIHYSVPAMSEVQYLPDAYPTDGTAGAPLRIYSALNEYEPASFVIYAFKQHGKVAFEVSDLKSKEGNVFPKSRLDLKTVKVWYQAGNAWYSYFQDNGYKLCPELLLNDEDLIKVDTRKVSNYARLIEKDGTVHYHWLTPPPAVDSVLEHLDKMSYRLDGSFRSMKPNFKDSKTFAGATLNEGEFKQFFLTAHVTEDCKPGVYSGAITLKDGGKVIGKIPVQLRILPFKLPDPMQYKNVNKPYRTRFNEYNGFEFVRALNGNDFKLAEKQLISILKNFAAHHHVIPGFRGAYNRFDIIDKAGLKRDFIATTSMQLTNLAEMRFDAKRQKEDHIRKFGRYNFNLAWGDEYGGATLRGILPMVKIYREEGFGFWSNSRHTYALAGWLANQFTPPVWPDFRSHVQPDKFTFVSPDNEYGWYACQHVGVENPAFNRRQYGLGPWRAGLTCNYNYAHHLDGFNDTRGGTFRAMNFIYTDGNGALTTIQWEAFREAIDDIRYATLIQQLARPLLNSQTNVAGDFAARQALKFLADLDSDDHDLSLVRLEMIRHILNLKKHSK